MIIYKLTALAFIILTPLFSMIMISLLRLGRRGIKFPDLALPLFVFDIVIVSGKFFTHHLLPYYLIVMSLLAIVMALLLIIRIQQFSYRRFFKLFWRVGFLVTLLFYLMLVGLIFIV
ncbi:DUF3397 domain-containing protein [Streptococcus equi subsp. zooepidemicus]|uniref:DUF3397 domain-containing protein n=1 Tax=Streptococcus equi TaxID=1336 RepID=UPI0010CABA51|nr:DUF3397 domain-containing protein [Streptococcus equi]MCD3411191.1 DUF3397 domain-containing protein [Streptococcus equi subsp. zooepidemicus]MCD3453413.1 DUF3397 domain-containing protein [Streptococcus equi subsp. zooepidemicus]MDI6075230.1 DUF3397 domain-containing protein [Streptococcus equi subsp. zooepidemicus]QUQ80506.1 hypothetical protein LJFMMFNO_01519 [Streptococcus equi subsp. zooepidemicus]VTS33168.1 membrane protein [Streptococcus equi subsp. zooepidemicus]